MLVKCYKSAPAVGDTRCSTRLSSPLIIEPKPLMGMARMLSRMYFLSFEQALNASESDVQTMKINQSINQSISVSLSDSVS